MNNAKKMYMWPPIDPDDGISFEKLNSLLPKRKEGNGKAKTNTRRSRTHIYLDEIRDGITAEVLPSEGS